ncbi:hypothetical protein N0V93_005942 [Gnomoniopsis smithogilvyi]|uniref:Alpha/beta hydrolase fold-3 domain-containing protein n=1 Tax=Gnomoniopsis smithogilvyi TaxID=1191159 RepID=A0A9W8YTR0_9PEZI|nr:hypothetical protein N0V93_005942 [Gnomoniopsis smithogilvyi]
MELQNRSDRSTFTLLLQVVLRPFKPRLVTLKNKFPAGSPRLTFDKIKKRVSVVEWQHQKSAIWLYDITPSHQAHDTPPEKKMHMYYFAGGGWQGPPSGDHWKLCAEFARKVPGLTVTIVSPPLAPNSPAASTFPMLRELYDSILESTDERIIFAGDSSGGNLALCLVLDGLERTGGHAASAKPAAVLAISPAVDLRPMEEMNDLSSRRDPLLTVASHNDEARMWAHEVDPASPWLSPVLADLTGLARAGIRVIGLTGSYDILTTSALQFRDACVASGVEGAWLQWERQMHCFPLVFSYRFAEAVVAKDWLIAQIKTL